MRRISVFLLFLSAVAGCHFGASGPDNNLPFNRNNELILTKHARCRMDCRHITAKELHEILDSGTVNYAKSEPDGRPDPKYAVEGYTDEHQHLRIIIAPEQNKLIVVTCMELGVEWQCDCN
jgi:hypothetical protein